MSGSQFPPFLGSWRNTLQGLVQTAMQIVDDLADNITYTQIIPGAYDTTTGTTTETKNTFTFNGAIVKFKTDETDNKVVISTDARLICAYLDLPIVPTTEDFLFSVNSNVPVPQQWKVVRVLGVPGDAMWNIQIRKV
jgi:hypothetical protein